LYATILQPSTFSSKTQPSRRKGSRTSVGAIVMYLGINSHSISPSRRVAVGVEWQASRALGADTSKDNASTRRTTMSTTQNATAAIPEAMKTHHAPVVRRPSEYPPELGRFVNTTQMVFHPTPDDPTSPNAGILNYLPGGGFPLHKHDFAQVWYVIEGECRFGEHVLRPGDMVYLADPHFEYEMHTENGCKILFVQYPGPTTGARPIYEGRFNKKTQVPVEMEDLEH
jgi:mannose-6-phosphate isomerase-like protein (cupin superfamily)